MIITPQDVLDLSEKFEILEDLTPFKWEYKTGEEEFIGKSGFLTISVKRLSRKSDNNWKAQLGPVSKEVKEFSGCVEWLREKLSNSLEAVLAEL